MERKARESLVQELSGPGILGLGRIKVDSLDVAVKAANRGCHDHAGVTKADHYILPHVPHLGSLLQKQRKACSHAVAVVSTADLRMPSPASSTSLSTVSGGMILITSSSRPHLSRMRPLPKHSRCTAAARC